MKLFPRSAFFALSFVVACSGGSPSDKDEDDEDDEDDDVEDDADDEDADDAQGGTAGDGGGGQSGTGGQGGAGGQGGTGGQGGKGGTGGTPVNNPPLSAFAYDSWPTPQTCKPFAKTAAPKTLSATGCVDANDAHKPAPSLFPYQVASPLWSDMSGKDRWVALPPGGKIVVEADGDWTLPNGSVLVKGFKVGNTQVETRLLVRHDDGEWVGYSYKWREDDKDADLLEASDSRFVGDQEWLYPSRMQCLECHRDAAGRTLGPETAQLNTAILYPNGKYANQIATMDKLGFFMKSPGDPKNLPVYPTPLDEKTGTLEQRARAYLQGNCAHCHRPNGVKEVTFDVRYTTALKDTAICDVNPSKNNFGFEGVKLMKPGDPELSMISIRMHSLAPNVRMPQIASGVVDEEGVKVIDAWIKSRTSCN